MCCVREGLTLGFFAAGGAPGAPGAAAVAVDGLLNTAEAAAREGWMYGPDGTASAGGADSSLNTTCFRLRGSVMMLDNGYSGGLLQAFTEF